MDIEKCKDCKWHIREYLLAKHPDFNNDGTFSGRFRYVTTDNYTDWCTILPSGTLSRPGVEITGERMPIEYMQEAFCKPAPLDTHIPGEKYRELLEQDRKLRDQWKQELAKL
jgi:hypothetical protein